MEPIIDPMFFYWCGICDTGRTVASFVAVMASAGAYIAFEAGYCKAEACARRVFKVLLPIAVITWPIAVFTPSKDTLILMQVAKNVTPDNVQSLKQLTGGVREAVKADIIDIIEAVTKEGDKSQ